MSNDFKYTDALGVTHLLAQRGRYDGFCLADDLDAEDGWDWPEATDKVDAIPQQHVDLWRYAAYGQRLYTVKFTLLPATLDWETELATKKAQWGNWHQKLNGEGEFMRVLPSANERYLKCIPQKAKWEEHRAWAKVTQPYLAANPWWYAKPMNTVVSAFDGATPVSVAYTNSGEIPTWPLITITGIVAKPRITLGSLYIEVNFTTLNADDLLYVDCRPGTRGIAYYAHGVGSPAYKTRSVGSYYVTIPTGAQTLSLSATSGTAAVTIAAYDYYGSLYA